MTDPFLNRLASAHLSRDADLSDALRWDYGTITGPVARLAGGTTHTDYLAGATCATAFATWHAGKRDIHYGATDATIGRTLRQLRTPGAKNNPQADRLLDMLISAETGEQLHRSIIKTITAVKGATHPPNWTLLRQQLIDWYDPEKRNTVRLNWAQQFTNPIPTTKEN